MRKIVQEMKAVEQDTKLRRDIKREKIRELNAAIDGHKMHIQELKNVIDSLQDDIAEDEEYLAEMQQVFVILDEPEVVEVPVVIPEVPEVVEVPVDPVIPEGEI